MGPPNDWPRVFALSFQLSCLCPQCAHLGLLLDNGLAFSSFSPLQVVLLPASLEHLGLLKKYRFQNRSSHSEQHTVYLSHREHQSSFVSWMEGPLYPPIPFSACRFHLS